jgi:hypothetical protein
MDTDEDPGESITEGRKGNQEGRQRLRISTKAGDGPRRELVLLC